MTTYHPALNNHGLPVVLNQPSKASPLSAWRDAKRSARKAVIEWLVRGCLAILVIGIAVKLGLGALVLK